MGLAVKQEKDALAMLESLNYSIGERIYDPLQNVHLRLCTRRSIQASKSCCRETKERVRSIPYYRSTMS